MMVSSRLIPVLNPLAMALPALLARLPRAEPNAEPFTTSRNDVL